jgi:predicted RNA-binding Zn-ribbon protein involved in translation (DUF1610 family)
MKKKILAVLLAISLLGLGTFSLIGHADFGDFAGDNDYGDWGGGDDWGNDSDWDWDSDDDYDSNGGFVYIPGGSSGGSGGGSTVGSIVMALIIVAVIVFFVLRRKGGGSAHPNNKPVAPGAQATDPSTLKPMSEYLTLDPTFSESEMREKISNLYVQFQDAWHAKDLTPLRPYLSDAYYAQSDRQLDTYRRNHQTSYIDRISVMDVALSGFKQTDGKDYIYARLKTRITNYVLDDNTGDLVRGSKTAEKFMEYEWEMVRSSGKTTVGSTGTVVQNCPNCGATVNINRTAQCEYCGSIITVDSYDWVLGGIKAISQRTVG